MTSSSPKAPASIGPRGMARRRAILEAAEHLFIEKGFEQTTLSDIIGRAGGSRATLYEHFGDKAGLFRAMMEENSADILAGLADARADDLASPEVELTKFALRFVQALLNDQTTAILRILVSEGSRIPDIAESFFRIGPETALTRLADYLRRLSEAGALRIDNPQVAARAFLGMVSGNILMRRLILPERSLPVDEIDCYVRQAVTLFLRGAGRR
ncbi:TetR/AcrR family transcriptional regulator [Azospirillum thermophilum]|uniref:TetR/AcrR family transcriptional regulator n=1 Tax=Azospirillum thermophilum TaxID=2202148 RepID=A0A2S2CUX3_9PROT|nr:TetR/AcrR family transcriptional regulator [Azospirillum thermophilum]AWK88276.1 TetR/AcrR family transcriptional regulator [Azospirillum thermophilum]